MSQPRRRDGGPTFKTAERRNCRADVPAAPPGRRPHILSGGPTFCRAPRILSGGPTFCRVAPHFVGCPHILLGGPNLPHHAGRPCRPHISRREAGSGFPRQTL